MWSAVQRRNAELPWARSHFFAMRNALSRARSTRPLDGLVTGVCANRSAITDQHNEMHAFSSARTLILQDVSHDPLSRLYSEVAQSEQLVLLAVAMRGCRARGHPH